MKKKLVWLLVLCLTLTSLFVGCNNGENTPAESSNAVTTEGKEGLQTNPPPSAGTENQGNTTTKAPETNDTEEPVETDPPAAKEEWITITSESDYHFFDKDGNEVAAVEGGEVWYLFPYWLGWENTQIYDSHGEGHYVTTTINCSKFKVGFGNGGPNGHTNVEIYIDDELVYNMNCTEEFDGMPNYSPEFETTPGEHVIKVKAGTPLTPETWNGLTFNCVTYVPAA